MRRLTSSQERQLWKVEDTITSESRYSLLSTIHSPEDLKKLDASQLPALCDELRACLVETISNNGGHLASNLGVVELTVALHRVFHSPVDQIVWDVGHQCYAHKLLTGRYDRFSTIRKRGGLSGFTKPCESEHDPYGCGHSSTSISAACGLARAKTLLKQEGYTIAVIGDGALTGGLAYEGLNNAGRSRDKLIVILNDNGMSISRNVGGIARHLAVIRSKPWYFRIKDHVEHILSHTPIIGPWLRNIIFTSKSMLKNALYHSTIFEEMGFAYLGPGDGHNIDEICRLLNRAKDLRQPALIHLRTIKGKGYAFAENNPRAYHGVGMFDIETGEPESSGTGFSEVFGDSLTELARKDNSICAITAAMAGGTGLTRFAHEFRPRFFDVGIAEEHAAVFAAGLARNGMLPVFAVYSTFLQRAYDQIIHDVALQNLHVVFAIDRAGLVGEDGETHQGIFDASFLSAVPNLTVYSPSCYEELRRDLLLALYGCRGPVALRYPRGAEPAMPDGYTPCGGPYVFTRRSSGVSGEILAVSYGRLAAFTAEAARRAAEEGLSVDLLRLNCIKPLDAECLRQASYYRKVVFFEECIRPGSVSEQFGERLLELGFHGDYRPCTAGEQFIKQGSVPQQLDELGLDVKGILQTMGKMARPQ